MLSYYCSNFQVIQKCKASGEDKVLAIVEASNFTALECITTKILDLVDTKPVITVESFARSLDISEELTQAVNIVLRREILYLVAINIEYYGKYTAGNLALKKCSGDKVLCLEIRNNGNRKV